MKQLVQSLKNGEMDVVEVPVPQLQPDGVLVRNYFSLVSAGTEKSKVNVARKNYLGKALERPDQVKKVLDTIKKEGLRNTYQKVMGKLDAPSPLGYSSAGKVIAVGENVTEFRVGDMVACAGAGFANHAEVVYIPRNLCAKVPEGVSMEAAAFTTVACVALQGIRQAGVKIGENVAVVGLGLVGQLTVQMLKAAGCNVVVYDLDEKKVKLALDSGACEGTSTNNFVKVCEHISNGFGVDATIITAGTSSNVPIETAGRITRRKGKVVVVGAVKMDIPRSPYYEKEIEICISCSYGPGRYDAAYEDCGIDYPYAYVRWTENRNMQSFLQLVKDNKIDVSKILTHKFKFNNAKAAYDLIMNPSGEEYIGILFEYDTSSEIIQTVCKNNTPIACKKVNLSVIGAGNFAKGVLIPALKRNNKIQLVGVMTSSGISAKGVADNYGFHYSASVENTIFDDISTNAILIATRHDHHARLLCEGLKRDKAVYVEKPLALNIDELQNIIKTYNESRGSLMVGFNRRFSYSIKNVKRFFTNRVGPMVVNYRINCGNIPFDHWIQDPKQGGGRIIGEVCHFIDVVQYLTDANPVKVYAESIKDSGKPVDTKDIVNINIRFSDGSISTINYLANGDTSLDKERIEVFCDGKVAIMNDFKQEEYISNGKTKVDKHYQDKGHETELDVFAQCIIDGHNMPIPFESMIYTTLTTFKILESIQTGNALEVDLIELNM